MIPSQPEVLTRDRALRKVVVVGGGLAGLSAAEAIKSSEPERFQVTVLESKRTVGGRAGSFHDSTTGEAVDYCQHVAMGCCTNLIALLNRCGLGDQLRRYRDLLFLHPNHAPSEFAPSRWLPAPFHLLPALSGLRFLTRGQRGQVRKAMQRMFRTPGQALVDQTALQWLQAIGQDEATIRDFWEVILVSALGERCDVVSMAAARKVFVDGFAGSVGASDVLVPSKPLAELFGIDLRNAIERTGIRVQSQATVRQICWQTETGVKLQDGSFLQADHVIVAVPWYATEGLIPEEIVPRVSEFAKFPVSPISGLHLWFDRAFTERKHAVMVGTVSQWMFRQPWQDTEGATDHYYQIVISASQQARQMPKDELIRTVVEEIRQAFPAARDAKLLRTRIVTDPKSVFSVRPEVERARPPAHTDAAWLHLAGDWIATGWPATMEGAVIGGRMAASSVLQREGLKTISVDPGLRRNWITRRLIR